MKTNNTIQRAIFCVTIALASILYVESASANKPIGNTLPRGAKYKTIAYSIKYENYSMAGYVHKNQFVKNQPLLVNTPTLSIEGIYYTDDNGYASIKGLTTKYTNANKSKIQSKIKGDFVISNSPNRAELVLKYKNEQSPFSGLFPGLNSSKNYATHIVSSVKDFTEMSLWREEKFNAEICAEDIPERQRTMQGVGLGDPARDKEFNTIITITKPTGNHLSTISIESSCKFSGQKSASESIYGHYSQASIVLDNGDVFDGSAYLNNDNIEIKSGTYKVSTGEILSGNIRKSYRYDNFLFGQQTTFTDGTFEYRNWLKQYDISERDWKSISSQTSNLTKQHKMVVDLHQKRVDAARLQEMARINLEKKSKDNEVKAKQMRALRKQALINKYGAYYAEQISTGKFEIGMTKAMVTEVWNKQCFIVRSQYVNGRTIETWIFSKDRMQQYLILEAHKAGNADAGGAAIVMIGLAEAYGVRLPRRFVFTDNKLTEVW